MTKRIEHVWLALRPMVDFGLVILAGLAALSLRETDWVRQWQAITYDYSRDDLWWQLLWIALLTVFFLSILRAYSSKPVGLWSQMTNIFSATTLTLVVIIVVVFWDREAYGSRFVILMGWGLTLLFLIAWQVILRFTSHGLQRHGYLRSRYLLVGRKDLLEPLQQWLEKYEKAETDVIVDLPSPESLVDNHKQHKVDEIIVLKEAGHNIHELLPLADFCQTQGIRFRYIPREVGELESRWQRVELAGFPMIELRPMRLYGWMVIAKRVLDLVGAGVIVLFFSPIMLAIAVAIKLETGGSVFYHTNRMGQGYRPFDYFKFKSMNHKEAHNKDEAIRYDPGFRKAHGDDPSNALVKLKDDPRITRVGKFIRRYSLDELGEVFNVFKGRMSLVGYRPHEPREVEAMPDWYRRAFSFKPGMTSLAAVTSRDLSAEEEAKLDLYYTENWSLLLDIKIILMTPWSMLKRRIKL